MGSTSVIGNRKHRDGICYRDAHSFVGICVKKVDNAILSSMASSALLANTLSLCKTECLN